MALFRPATVHDVPMDVLSDIFLLATTSEDSSVQAETENWPSVIFPVSHVCKFWKATALSYPKLWSYITLTCRHVQSSESPLSGSTQAEGIKDLVKLMVERSSGYCLSITVLLSASSSHFSLIEPALKFLYSTAEPLAKAECRIKVSQSYESLMWAQKRAHVKMSILPGLTDDARRETFQAVFPPVWNLTLEAQRQLGLFSELVFPSWNQMTHLGPLCLDQVFVHTWIERLLLGLTSLVSFDIWVVSGAERFDMPGFHQSGSHSAVVAAYMSAKDEWDSEATITLPHLRRFYLSFAVTTHRISALPSNSWHNDRPPRNITRVLRRLSAPKLDSLELLIEPLDQAAFRTFCSRHPGADMPNGSLLTKLVLIEDSGWLGIFLKSSPYFENLEDLTLVRCPGLVFQISYYLEMPFPSPEQVTYWKRLNRVTIYAYEKSDDAEQKSAALAAMFASMDGEIGAVLDTNISHSLWRPELKVIRYLIPSYPLHPAWVFKEISTRRRIPN